TQHLLLVALTGLGEDDGERREREVDEEDPAPRDPLDERAANGRPRNRGYCRERRPEPDRASGLVAVDAAQKGERVRRQKGARDPLQRAGEDEKAARRGEAGEDRGNGEARGSRDERRSPPVAVADGAADEIERSEGERVGEDDPLLAGEAEVEVLRDRG